MTFRTAVVYAVLFLASMLAAFLTWSSEPEPAGATGVVVLEASVPDIEAVRFESDEFEASLEARTDSHGDYVWVTTTRRPKAVSPTTGDDAPAATTAAFKGGVSATQLLESMAPLRVSRQLDVPESKHADFGFDDPEAELSIRLKSGARRRFEVGDAGYGHRHVYLRDPESGNVYVGDTSLVAPLERADTRLPDKRLFDFERAQVVQARIVAGEETLVLEQRNREDTTAARWIEAGSGAANDTAQSWLDKIFRLRSSSYVAKSEISAPREPVFRVTLTPADSAPVDLVVSRTSAGPQWFAESDFTRGLVRLDSAGAAEAFEDLGTLFP